MKSNNRLPARIFTCLGISLFIFVTVVCLLAGWTVDTLYFRHFRAESLWERKEPPHYRYTIEVHSSVWFTHYQIEILQDEIISMINLDTGQPAEFWLVAPGGYLQPSSSLWDFLVIDKMFDQIGMATSLPRSPKSFAARLDPSLYAQAVSRGWVGSDWLGCEIAYPSVTYHPEYGYPLELHLPGNFCSWILEQKMPTSIKIQSFQKLP